MESRSCTALLLAVLLLAISASESSCGILLCGHRKLHLHHRSPKPEF